MNKSLIFIVSSCLALSACGRIVGEKGLLHDRSNAYLESKNGQPLQLPEGVKAKDISHYYDIPEIKGQLAINKVPPGSAIAESGASDQPKLKSLKDKQLAFSQLDGQPSLVVNTPLKATFRHIVDALGRQKMRVIHKDDTRHVYRINNLAAKPGTPLATLDVHVIAKGSGSEIYLTSIDGKRIPALTSQRLLNHIALGLKGQRRFTVVPNYPVVI